MFTSVKIRMKNFLNFNRSPCQKKRRWRTENIASAKEGYFISPMPKKNKKTS